MRQGLRLKSRCIHRQDTTRCVKPIILSLSLPPFNFVTFHVTSHSRCRAIIIALTRYPSRAREDALASVRRAVSQIKYLLAPGREPVEFRGEDGSHEFNRNIVRGDHQSSAGGRRAERRKQDGEERRPGFYDLASRGRPGSSRCLSAFRARERASWLPSKQGRSRFGEIPSRESK